jgi:hypothetical protein
MNEDAQSWPVQTFAQANPQGIDRPSIVVYLHHDAPRA